MSVKLSRFRHVLITSVIFLVIIGIIVWVYDNLLNDIKSNTEELKWRVVATEDIEPNQMITSQNVTMKQVQDVIKVDNLIYKLNSTDTNAELVSDGNLSAPIDDGLWAIGKTATTKIHKGEFLVADDLVLADEVADPNKRIYSIPFDSLATGGYNVKVGDNVDICILYSGDYKTIREYQNLDDNKVIDIVLAKKEIRDIRDESGNSQIANPSVVPGYVCFELTYDEINKVELAKRQGNVFVGIAETYLGEPYNETFMEGTAFPSF